MQANWWSQPHQALTPQEECISRLICKYYVQGEFDPRKLEFKVDNNRLYFRYTKGRWIAWYSTNVIVSGGGGYFDIDKYAININDATGEATIVDRDVVTNPKESLHAVREITSPNVNMGYMDVTDLGQNVLFGNMNYIQYENGSSSSKNVTFGITKNALGEAVKNAVSIPADIKIEGDNIYLVDGNNEQIGDGTSLDGISRVIDFNEKINSFTWDETNEKWVANVSYNRTGNSQDNLQLNISLDDIVGGLSGQFATGVSSSADGGYQLISGSSPIGDPFYVHRVIDFNDDTFRFSRTGDNVQATISYSTDSNASDSYTLTIPVNAFSENLAKGLSTSKDSNNRTTSIGLVFMNSSISWVTLDLGSLVGGSSSNGRYINLLALSGDNKFYDADTETDAVVARKDTNNDVIIGLETVLGNGTDNNLKDKAYIRIPKAYLGATNGLAVGENADGTPAIGMAGEDNTLDASVNTVPLSDIIAGITGGVEGENEWWVGLTHTVGGTSTEMLSSISFLDLFGGGEGGGAGGANKFVKLEASDKAGNAYSDGDGYFRYVKASSELQTSLKVTVGGLSDAVNLHIESGELRSAVTQVLGGLSMDGSSLRLMDDQNNTFGQGVTFKDIVNPNGDTPIDELLKIGVKDINGDQEWNYGDRDNYTISEDGTTYKIGLNMWVGSYSSKTTSFNLNISGALSGDKTHGMTVLNNQSVRRNNADVPDAELKSTRVIGFANSAGDGIDISYNQNTVAQIEIVNGISTHVSGSDTYLQLTYYENATNPRVTFGNSISLRSILNPEGGEGGDEPVTDPSVIDLGIRAGSNMDYSKLGEFYELNSDYYGDFQIKLGRYVTSASIKLGSDILNNALQSISISGDVLQDTRKITLSPSVSGNENGINTSRIVKGLSVGRIDGSSETQLTLTYIGDDDKTYAFGGVNIQTLFSSYSSSSSAIYNSEIIDLQIRNKNNQYAKSGNFNYDSNRKALSGDFIIYLGGSEHGYKTDAQIYLDSAELRSAVSDVIGGLSVQLNPVNRTYTMYVVDDANSPIGFGATFEDLIGGSSGNGKPALSINGNPRPTTETLGTKINRTTVDTNDFIYAFNITPSVGGVNGSAVSAYLDLNEIGNSLVQKLTFDDRTLNLNPRITGETGVPANEIVSGLSVVYNSATSLTQLALTYEDAQHNTHTFGEVDIQTLFSSYSSSSIINSDIIDLQIKNLDEAYTDSGNFIYDSSARNLHGDFRVILGGSNGYYADATITLESSTLESAVFDVIGGLSISDNGSGVYNLYIKDTKGKRIGSSVSFSDLLGDSGKPNLDITSLTDESYAGATLINRNTLSDDFIYAFTMTPSVGGVTGNIASAYLNLTELVTDARQSLEWSDFTDSGNRALKLSNNASTVPVSSIVNGLSMYGNNKDRYISLTYDHAGGTSFGNAINIKELFGGSSGDTDLIKLGIANGTTTNYVQNGEFIKSVDDGDYYGYFKVSLGDYSSSAQILLRSVTIRSEARSAIGGLYFDDSTGELYIKGSSSTERIGDSVTIGTLTSIDLSATAQNYRNDNGELHVDIPLSLTVYAHGKSATSSSTIDLDIIDVTKFNVSKNTAGSLVFKYDTIELSSPVDLTPALQDLTELTGLAIKGTDTTTNRITNMTKEFQTYVGGDYENSATIHEALGQLYLNNKDFPQVVAQHVPTPDTYENQRVNENTRVLMVHPPGITDISRTALDNEHITFVRGVPGNVGHQTYDANLYYFIS